MNRLATTTSPYLLQHQANPVDWWPWGDDAFAEARRMGKPILLSVGYAACHWCHVMAHESFDDHDVARVMNALFVNIKVDREERPDIDHIYMSALHALGEQGGWPLTMFLTPEGEPFWGGTYFPREARFGRPAFVTVLQEVARVFHDEPSRVDHNRQLLARALRGIPAGANEAGGGLDQANLDRVGVYLRQSFDPVNGGLAGAPKFPNPTMLECLWRHADRTGDSESRSRFLTTLERMALGGIHDHVGGGFARYAIDERWLVPHFEKMLYDNAQLLELLALAAAETGRPLFREAAEGIVAWARREMTTADGAFSSSLDADSEGQEGRFYVWSADEIAGVLADDAALFAGFYDVTDAGNWEGHVILNRLAAPEPDPATARRLAAMRGRLLEARSRRPRPGLDDKILADWNGLMIGALVRAALLLRQPAWLDDAQRAYRCIAESMTLSGRLGHSARGGSVLFPGFASDYAAMGRAALVLYEATGASPYLDHARHWLNILHTDYRDAESGLLHMTAAGASGLIMRPRPSHDDAVPNANGLYAEALVRLAMVTGAEADRQLAEAILTLQTAAARAAPIAHASILNALDLSLRGAAIVVIEQGGHDVMRQAALAIPYPNRSVSGKDTLAPQHPASPIPLGSGDIALVCAGRRCSLPVRDPNRLPAEIAAMTGTGG